jgi:hypothetical protein
MSFSFDGPNKRINITSAATISLRDLWSRWVDWVLTSDNSKYAQAFAQVGGNDIDLAAGTYIPIYLFLLNGWRIKPQESDHTLAVQDGVIVVNGGGDPFVNTNGAYVVRINYQQPVQAIAFSTTGGGSAPTAEQNAAALLAAIVENGMPVAHIFRIVLAALVGRSAGTGTDTESYKSADGSKDRVTVTYDASNNRTTVVLDGA